MAGQMGSALFSAAGSIMQGQEEKNADYANARIARVNATSDELASKANAAQIETQTKGVLGQAAASAGASGVEMTGSPLAVMHNIASRGELARQMTLYEGRNQARGQQTQAALDTDQGQVAAQAGYLQAGSTILTSADKGANQLFPGTMAAVGG